MVTTGARAGTTATHCEACGWPFDEEARVTGDCALCAPHDPEPHVSWHRHTTAKLAIVAPALLVALVSVVLLFVGVLLG